MSTARSSRRLQVRWAQRGYNPHHRKVPSYYPITAYEAQSGHVLRVQNGGNINDAKGARRFSARPVRPARATLGAGCGSIPYGRAFFRRDILERLDGGCPVRDSKCRSSVAGLKAGCKATRTWTRITGAELRGPRGAGGLLGSPLPHRDLSPHVQHRRRRTSKLDLFDPNDGHYEYSRS